MRTDRDGKATLLKVLGLHEETGRLTLIEGEAIGRVAADDPLDDLALIVGALYADARAPQRHALVRLSTLVTRSLDMQSDEGRVVWALSDAPARQMERTAPYFHVTLVEAMERLRLQHLFASSSAGEHHRSICPAAYNERSGEIYPVEMAQWRADFRAMAPARQMVAASIVWMYQSGPDSTWLRRVPCTWMATEALRHLRDAGCLSVWLRLIATFPGW